MRSPMCLAHKSRKPLMNSNPELQRLMIKESTDPNWYTAKAKFCFCRNNKRTIIT